MDYLLITNPYCLIFYNSLQSALILSLRSENAWHAALGFGGYNMALATFLAFTGSTFGMSLLYGLGYYISRWRSELPAFSENFYQRVAGVFARRLFVFMIMPPVSLLEVMPLLPLFVILNGMMRVPPKRAIAAIAISRALYYAYYLTQPAAI